MQYLIEKIFWKYNKKRKKKFEEEFAINLLSFFIFKYDRNIWY